jgi:hypothetical protein
VGFCTGEVKCSSLSQMSLDSQMEQLCALYEEKSDGELLQLHAGREDLTEVAQQALEQVMRGRRLSPEAADLSRPGIEDEPVEIDAEPLIAENEVCVCRFRDAIEANEALQWLEEAGIQPRVVNFQPPPESDPRFRRVQIDLGVVVRRKDEKAARALLEERTALSPEVEDNPLAELHGLQLVGIFERPDALLAAQALGEAGISYVWDDGGDDWDTTRDGVSIQVKGRRVEEAQKLVQERLGVVDEGS